MINSNTIEKMRGFKLEEVEKVAEDLYLIKQPFHEIFTGVTVVLGKSNVGLVDSGLETTPTNYVFPLLLKMKHKPEDINYVVNTHRDGDHIWGNKVIQEKTKAKIAEARSNSARVKPFWDAFFIYCIPQNIIGHH